MSKPIADLYTSLLKGPRARAVLIAFLVLATLFFFARLASRWPQWGGAGYRWDDGVATICYLPIVASVVCGLVMVHYGMGQDVWALPIPYVLHWAKVFIFPTRAIIVLSPPSLTSYSGLLPLSQYTSLRRTLRSSPYSYSTSASGRRPILPTTISACFAKLSVGSCLLPPSLP